MALAGNEHRSGSDSSELSRAITVTADNELEADTKARAIAKLLGLTIFAGHNDGFTVYQVVDEADPLETFMATRQCLLEAEAAQKERTRLASMAYQMTKVGDRV